MPTATDPFSSPNNLVGTADRKRLKPLRLSADQLRSEMRDEMQPWRGGEENSGSPIDLV